LLRLAAAKIPPACSKPPDRGWIRGTHPAKTGEPNRYPPVRFRLNGESFSKKLPVKASGKILPNAGRVLRCPVASGTLQSEYAHCAPVNGYRHLRLDALAALVVFFGVETRAEPPPDSPPASTQPHSASPKITEAVAAKLPRYVPPVPAKLPDFSQPNEAGDSSDDILNLPKMTIRPAAPLPPSEFAFLSPKGRVELAMKTNPGLHFGNILGSNSGPNGPALAIQADEREALRKATTTDLVDRTTINDDESAKKIRQLLQAAVQRANSDWLTAKGGKPERP
jgi:hypothetical protein